MFERIVCYGVVVVLMVRNGSRGMKMMELNEEAADRPVAIASGEQMRVTLAEAGGTGYRWRVGTGCEGLLHLDGEHKDNAGPRLGASSKRSWVYTARGDGSCELRFESARSWEKAVTGKTVSFPVTVRKAD